MKNNSKLPVVLVILVMGIMIFTAKDAEAVKPLDSLRVGKVIKGIKALTVIVQDSIIPELEGDEKKNMKGMVSELNKFMKKSENQFKDTLLADFSKLSPEEKASLTQMEDKVFKIKSSLPEKSVHYHLVSLGHLPVYRALQEMRTDGRTPLLATYTEPFDPNTSSNQQVIMTGAYLNFYLEYRINVGGIEMGPDIVDPERLVFTFPSKLLEGITSPTFIEVKAAPKKQTGVGSSARFDDNPEQHAWVLVYPVKKKP